MPKEGMKRLDWTHTQPANLDNPSPELQGKANTEGKGQENYRWNRRSEPKGVYTEKSISLDAYRC